MEMIAHQHPGMHPPTKAPVRLFHQIRPREPVLVVIKNILPAIPPRHHMIDGTCRLVSQRSRHA